MRRRFVVEFGVPEAQATERLRSETGGVIDDIVATYFPDSENTAHRLVGVVSDSRVRLCTPGRVRRPWWWIAPVFHGEFVSTDEDRCALEGTLRLRLRTLIGVVLYGAVLWVIAGDAGIWLATATWLGLLSEVAFLSPRTSRELLRRIQTVAERTKPRPPQPTPYAGG